MPKIHFTSTMSSRSKSTTQTATALVRLFINAGQATPAPPVGPALAQTGIRANEFCKIFNEQSKTFIPGTPLPTRIRINADRTFVFQIKVPTTFHLLKIACTFEKGSTEHTVAKVPAKLIYEVAKIKAKDPNFASVPLKSVFRSVLATARHVGIEVVP